MIVNNNRFDFDLRILRQQSINHRGGFVGIGIPTCDRPKQLKICLQSLQKQSVHDKIGRLVIIDNNRNGQYIRPSEHRIGTDLIVVRPQKNEKRLPQFASISHDIALHLMGDMRYILRFDDDQEMQDEYFLENLLDTIQKQKDCAAVGGLYPFATQNKHTDDEKDGFCQMGRWILPYEKEVKNLHSSFLYDTEVVNSVGGFAHQYHGWYEQDDVSMRIRHLANKKLYVNGNAIAIHHRAGGGLRYWHESEYAGNDRVIFDKRMKERGIEVDI